MAEKLQGLLEKIRKEGLEKADEEKNKIIAEAEENAKKIISKAKADADDTRKKAEEDADALEKRAKRAIQQAARDIILKLKDELQARLDNIIRTTSDAALTPEFMGEIILKMVQEFKKTDAAEPALEALVTPKYLEKMEKLLAGSLAKDFKNEPCVFPGSDIGGGLKIGFKGSDVFYDFSDDAIADIIGAYIGPRLAEIIAPEKEK